MSSKTSNPLARTKPIYSSDPHDDLRVVWDATGTRILSDRRPNPTAKTTPEDK